ncbi:hypothetical protein [Flexibacterium corallicola]|uniref:hypothetical protein n=1 Tax=Flexibacterium corallicola TaxID=3037259 RepID=UPI00286EC341|nr:hypothetical protein [Pseudovibrio sp. M1P-2-3]
MSEVKDNVAPRAKIRSLRETIHKVRLADVERGDVVVGLHERERAQLELLNEELAEVFKEIPEDDDYFSFQLVSGTRPRLWIDITSHVVMGRDLQTYRFLKDTRLGRSVLLESSSLDEMADCVTLYIAERILERDKAIEADWMVGSHRLDILTKGRHSKKRAIRKLGEQTTISSRYNSQGLFSFALGLLIGAAALIGFAWFANPMN